MPSKPELQLIYNCRDVVNNVSKNRGGQIMSIDDAYWTSFQFDQEFAWYVDFFYGYMCSPTYKNDLLKVRPVRLF